WIPDDKTAQGRRNDVRCISIEHKLGQHGAPTCTMIYGDNDACEGYLIGAEDDGMRAMFTMMNNARLNVGIQGLSYAERAHQEALHDAQSRVQSRALDGGTGPVAIIRHPDERRMLLSQRAKIDGVRAL